MICYLNVQLEDEDRLHLISMDEDEDEQCIRLLSFCKKHRPPSTERSAKDDRITQAAPQCSDYSPPSNPSGCARSGVLSFYSLLYLCNTYLNRLLFPFSFLSNCKSTWPTNLVDATWPSLLCL